MVTANFSTDFLLNSPFLLEFVAQGYIVITISVDYDNIINLLQGLTIIAKALVPIIQLLPAECTTIVAAGSGAHLGSAVIGGLPADVTFKKIYGKSAQLS